MGFQKLSGCTIAQYQDVLSKNKLIYGRLYHLRVEGLRDPKHPNIVIGTTKKAETRFC